MKENKDSHRWTVAVFGKTRVGYDESLSYPNEILCGRTHIFRPLEVTKYLDKRPALKEAAWAALRERRDEARKWYKSARRINYDCDTGRVRIILGNSTIYIHNGCGDCRNVPIYIVERNSPLSRFPPKFRTAMDVEWMGLAKVCDYDCGEPHPVIAVMNPSIYVSNQGDGAVLLLVD